MPGKRTNALTAGLLNFFFGISTPCRLLIEVFTRRRFGHRYYAFAASIAVLLVLAAFPCVVLAINSDFGTGHFLLRFFTWYVFLAVFGIESWNRHKEIDTKWYEVDFSKYSQYGGDRIALFRNRKVWGIEANQRTISIFFEPGLFLIIGIVLALFLQPIGFVLIFASINHSLGYLASFKGAVNYLQDIADGLTFQEELRRTVDSGRNPDRDKGFEFFEMPIDPELRKRMAAFMTGQNEVLYAS